MNEIEPVLEVSRKSRLSRWLPIVALLWPSIVMLLPVLGYWVYFYDDVPPLLLFLLALFFSVICFICFLIFIVMKKWKMSLSFLIPLLLAATTISRLFIESRDYAEFRVYDARHHIKAEVRQQGYRYKEWPLDTHDGYYHRIVYDVTDEIGKKDGIDNDGCYDSVFKVGEHFYFYSTVCSGI